MPEQTDPTSPENPSADDGQTGKTVLERIRQLESAQQAEKDAREQAEERARKAEESRDKLQADRDRAKAQLDRIKAKQEQDALGTNAPIEELRTFANDKARENLVLRELMKAKLTMEDLDVELDELNSPAEVKNAIKVARLEKQIAAQDQQLHEVVDAEKLSKEAKEEAEKQPASRPPVDTGGPSSPAPADSVSESSPEALRAKAAELKKIGTPEALQEAQWLILNAAYEDPDKIVGRGHGGATVEG